MGRINPINLRREDRRYFLDLPVLFPAQSRNSMKYLLILMIFFRSTALAGQFYFLDSLEQAYEDGDLTAGASLAIELSTSDSVRTGLILSELSNEKIDKYWLELVAAYQRFEEREKISNASIQSLQSRMIEDNASLPLGYLYLLQSLYDVRINKRFKSKYQLEKALQHFEDAQYDKGIGDVYHARAFFAKKTKRDRLAIRNYRLAVDYYIAAKSKVIFQPLLNLANQYLQQELIDSAAVHYERAQTLLASTDLNTMKMLVASQLSEIYDQLGHKPEADSLKEAILAFQNSDSLQEVDLNEVFPSFFNRGKNKRSKTLIKDAAKDWQAEKNELLLKQLETENALKKTQLKFQKLGLISAISIAILIALIALMVYRKNRKIREQKIVIEASLSEKETLLREIHHRVKNNLQVISSLLRIQSHQTNDEAAIQALNEGQARVQTMSLIHQDLYNMEGLKGIEMKSYLERLSENLFRTYNISQDRIQMTTNVQSINLDVDTVIPLGLIINELITNALKYAFPGKKEGVVKLTLEEVDNHLILSVEDNGLGGLKTDVLNDSSGFGYEIIQAFADKMEATLNIKDNNGTKVTLIIKDYQKT